MNTETMLVIEKLKAEQEVFNKAFRRSLSSQGKNYVKAARKNHQKTKQTIPHPIRTHRTTPNPNSTSTKQKYWKKETAFSEQELRIRTKATSSPAKNQSIYSTWHQTTHKTPRLTSSSLPPSRSLPSKIHRKMTSSPPAAMVY